MQWVLVLSLCHLLVRQISTTYSPKIIIIICSRAQYTCRLNISGGCHGHHQFHCQVGRASDFHIAGHLRFLTFTDLYRLDTGILITFSSCNDPRPGIEPGSPDLKARIIPQDQRSRPEILRDFLSYSAMLLPLFYSYSGLIHPRFLDEISYTSHAPKV